jgi:hypothetical protein
MATDLPQVSYKQQVKSGRNPDGTRHDGAGDPLMGLDRITTEDWEIGRVAAHLSCLFSINTAVTLYPIRFYRTAEHHASGLDQLTVFGEIETSGTYTLEYRLGDGNPWVVFALAGASVSQWHPGSTERGTFAINLTSVVNDWVTVKIDNQAVFLGRTTVWSLGGWLEAPTLPVI